MTAIDGFGRKMLYLVGTRRTGEAGSPAGNEPREASGHAKEPAFVVVSAGKDGRFGTQGAGTDEGFGCDRPGAPPGRVTLRRDGSGDDQAITGEWPQAGGRTR